VCENEFPNVWEKMSENRRGDFLTHPVHAIYIGPHDSLKYSQVMSIVSIAV